MLQVITTFSLSKSITYRASLQLPFGAGIELNLSSFWSRSLLLRNILATRLSLSLSISCNERRNSSSLLCTRHDRRYINESDSIRSPPCQTYRSMVRFDGVYTSAEKPYGEVIRQDTHLLWLSLRLFAGWLFETSPVNDRGTEWSIPVFPSGIANFEFACELCFPQCLFLGGV